MATGMVLIIVSRNIDLSVGSLLGLPRLHDGDGADRVDPRRPSTSGFGPAVHVDRRARSSASCSARSSAALQGFLVAYGGVPAFIVTLGGFLVWRGLIFRFGKQGQTLAPLDETFQLLGGGPKGSLGEWKSWVLGGRWRAPAIVGQHRRSPGAAVSATTRRPRRRGSTSALGVVGCASSRVGSPTATTGRRAVASTPSTPSPSHGG